MPGPADRLAPHRATLAAVRAAAPLVHCIVPAVTMPLVADALSACGARPMMTETAAEAPLLAARADALLVDLGTLSGDGAAGAPLAAHIAGGRGTPWVLDPAAIGPTPLRRTLASLLLRLEPSIVRGNADEVALLAELAADPAAALAIGASAGPDSHRGPDDVIDAARRLASATGAVVSCSGAVDLVVGRGRSAAAPPAAGAEWRFAGGHPALARLVGTGCALGAITAACAAVAPPAEAARAALAWVGLAAERAVAGLAPAAPTGPGTFRSPWLDALDALGAQAEPPRGGEPAASATPTAEVPA